jgi:DNA-binding response OmpR family regulator
MRPRDRDRVRGGGEQQHVDVGAGEACVEQQGLVAQLEHSLLGEQAQVGFRLGDQDACHRGTWFPPARGGARYFSCESPMNPRVLVIDDEPDVRSLLCELLADRGYLVEEARDGADGLRVLYDKRPDLVLLDLAMPQMDGWRTLERIRELSDVPVLILTSRAGELEKVRGLRAGADDYVVKPFSGEELIARVEALLRRPRSAVAPPERYQDGLLTIEYLEHRVLAGGQELALTPLEFRLLCAFVDHPRQVLSHEQLLERVWHDPRAVSPDQVRLYVGYLRRKIGSGGSRIETVRGFGYRYLPPRSAEGRGQG